MDGMDFLYKTERMSQFFGSAWCGPEKFEHGKETLVAAYLPGPDGQGVSVFCTAMPAVFYKLVVSPGVTSASEVRPGYTVTTGSDMAHWAAQTAIAITQGMVGFKPTTGETPCAN